MYMHVIGFRHNHMQLTKESSKYIAVWQRTAVVAPGIHSRYDEQWWGGDCGDCGKSHVSRAAFLRLTSCKRVSMLTIWRVC